MTFSPQGSPPAIPHFSMLFVRPCKSPEQRRRVWTGTPCVDRCRVDSVGGFIGMRRRQPNSQWRRAALVLLALAGVYVAILCVLFGAHPTAVHAQPEAEYVDPVCLAFVVACSPILRRRLAVFGQLLRATPLQLFDIQPATHIFLHRFRHALFSVAALRSKVVNKSARAQRIFLQPLSVAGAV